MPLGKQCILQHKNIQLADWSWSNEYYEYGVKLVDSLHEVLVLNGYASCDSPGHPHQQERTCPKPGPGPPPSSSNLQGDSQVTWPLPNYVIMWPHVTASIRHEATGWLSKATRSFNPAVSIVNRHVFHYNFLQCKDILMLRRHSSQAMFLRI